MSHSMQTAHAALYCPGLATLLHQSNSKRCRVWQRRALQTVNTAPTQKINESGGLHKSSSIASGSVPSSQSLPAPLPIAAPLPNHIAVIMDGNSRWAKQRGLPKFSGHQTGVEAMRRTVQFCCRRGIQCMTVFALSTENWQRGREEVEFLLKLIQRVVNQELEELINAGVHINFIGDRSNLPQALIDQLQRAEAATAHNSRLYLTVALSYSGRQDITSAVQNICRRVAAGELDPDEVTSDLISSSLSLNHLPAAWRDPDLMIRTSERRLSNFLLWESAYSELHFSDVLWPDFGEKELEAALDDYARRERRFGRH